MKAIIKFFLDNSKLTFVLTLFTLLLGINGARQILREEIPTVDLGEAKIITYYEGATAEEVEAEVTKKIEDRIKEVKGIKDVTSISQINMSIIRVRIDMDNFDQYEVMDDIKTQVDKVAGLPEGATKPDLIEINTEEMTVIELAVVGENKGRERDAYIEYLEDELKDIKGVLKTESFGYAEREFSVKLKLDKLIEYNVGVDEVVNALKNRNITVPAGSLKSYTYQAMVRVDAKAKNATELGNALIRSNFDGKKIYVKDLATVEDLMEDKEAYTKINGKECSILTIKKQGGIDTVQLANEVKNKVEEIKKQKHVDFDIIYFVNAATDVENKFNIIVSNVISGFAILLVLLLIFLPGKLGIMTTMSLPIIVCTTLGLMPSLGINLDTISMLAIIIAMGMLVDNSIMISENFATMIEEGKNIKTAALECVSKFWVAILTSTLTTIFAFMPMLLTKGVMGLFVRAIPILVSITLFISLIECMLFMPSRLKLIGGSIVKTARKNKKNGKNSGGWFKYISDWFENIVYICVKLRYISLCAFIFILWISFYFIGKNKFILFPAENVTLYNIKYETNVGDSLEKTSDLTDRLTDDIRRTVGTENIDNIVAYIGQSGTGITDTLQQNHHTAEIRLYINEEKSYQLDHYKVLEDLRRMDVSYLNKFEVTEESSGPPVGRAVEASFRSTNINKLYEALNYVYEKFKNVKGIIDLETDDYKNDDEIFVRIDYEKVARLGLSTSDIGNAIKASIAGIDVSKITLNEREFSMKVKFDDNFKKTQEDLEKIKIRDENNNLIPLDEIASFDRKEGSRIKHRYNFKKSITLRANVDEKLITALEANKKVFEFFDEIKEKYPEVSVKFIGEQESSEESFQSLVIATQFAIVLMFACLVFIFNSYMKPILIMTTIPLGLFGFSLAFYLHGRPISFMSLIGVIGLAGVVINVGIILITFIEMFKKEYKNLDLNHILAKSAGARLRAVLASALTTIAGLMPTAYAIGGRDASLIPVTLAMSWGLVSSTFLSLIWIPCAYGILEDCTRFFRKQRVALWLFKKRNLSKKVY